MGTFSGKASESGNICKANDYKSPKLLKTGGTLISVSLPDKVGVRVTGNDHRYPLILGRGPGTNHVPSHLSKDCPESLFAQPQCEVLARYGEACGSHRVTHEVESAEREEHERPECRLLADLLRGQTEYLGDKIANEHDIVMVQ